MIDPRAILAHPPLEVPYRYGPRDVMLHALGTGIGLNPLDTDQLRFAYEDLQPPLLVLPTFPIVLGWVDMVRDPRRRDPRLGLDGNEVVVGQASVCLHRALDVEGEGRSRSFFAEVVDKGPGRGALVCVRREVMDQAHTLLATVDTWLFIRKAGGFGGCPEGGLPRTEPPQREPDVVVEQPTGGNQALLYRLCLGDHNAVHADPGHAAATGFPQPILHGLASLSMSLHAAISGATGSLSDHAVRLLGAHATMTRPVYPGDHLRTEVWTQDSHVHFRTGVPARGEVVVSGGSLTLAPQA